MQWNQSVSITQRKWGREEERRKQPYKETHELPAGSGVGLCNNRGERREQWWERNQTDPWLLSHDSYLFDLVLASRVGSFNQN